MMRSSKGEGRLKAFLRLQNSKEDSDEMLQKNEDEIEKKRDALCNSESQKTLIEKNNETLRRRVEIVAKVNEMLKPSEDPRPTKNCAAWKESWPVEWREQQFKPATLLFTKMRMRRGTR